MAVLGMGTKLLIGANSIVDLTEISGLEISADTVETTTLESTGGYRTFIQGLKDAGEVSISGYFNPADTNGQKKVYDLLGTGAETSFSIVFPASLGASWSFSGIVTGFTTSAAMEDLIPFEGTIKLSGVPSLGLTTSAGLSGLSLSGGTLTPTFSNSKYAYYVSVAGSSTTVTATGASHTLNLYVDGTFVQSLTSGSASSSVALAAVNDSKVVQIVAYESGKTQKIYEVVIVRAS
jgi:predicted secreted protein